MKTSKGFTLVELMITVAIIGILAAIAYPSYQNAVIKGNRASAKSFLMEVSQRQSQYLLDQRAYAANLTDLSVTAPVEVTKFYNVTIALSGPPPGYEIKAEPKPGTRQAGDGDLTLTHTGAKTGKW